MLRRITYLVGTIVVLYACRKYCIHVFYLCCLFIFLYGIRSFKIVFLSFNWKLKWTDVDGMISSGIWAIGQRQTPYGWQSVMYYPSPAYKLLIYQTCRPRSIINLQVLWCMAIFSDVGILTLSKNIDILYVYMIWTPRQF